MGHYKDTTVEISFNGVTHRVSQGVADSLRKSGKLDKPKGKEKESKAKK